MQKKIKKSIQLDFMKNFKPYTKKFNLIIIFVSAFIFAQCKTFSSDFFTGRFGNVKINPSALNEVLTFALPINEENIYQYSGHNLEFSPEHLQARWVGYFLTKEKLQERKVKRSSKFYEDKKIKDGCAKNSDYKNSGYDRGHLAPAADMLYSKEAAEDSFLLSNISPQTPGFNRGKWLELETFVRKKAEEYGTLYILTGPVLNSKQQKTIGKSGVTVPEYFYKALLVYTDNFKEAIGFIMPNTKLYDNLSAYACPVDEVEIFSGIDFFSCLSDDEEEKIENSYNYEFWFESGFESKNSAENKTEKEFENKIEETAE